MPNGTVFIDMNVWVAHSIEDHPFHERAVAALSRLAEREETLCISAQVVREFISVCTLGRNLSRPLAWEEVREIVQAMLAEALVLIESEISARRLIDLGSHYQVIGKQIHDTNIVATMLAHNTTHLVTLNPDDFKRFTEIEVIVP